ncbi:hypothetical protein [Trinickia sp.]
MSRIVIDGLLAVFALVYRVPLAVMMLTSFKPPPKYRAKRRTHSYVLS